MSESVKTLIFAAVAVVAVLVAVFTYPKQEEYQPPETGRQVACSTSSPIPSDAAELKIAKFSEDLGQLTEFEVVRDATTGLWTIPSSSNYPADAEAQMRDAATSLIDLQVLGHRLRGHQGPSGLRRDRAGPAETGSQPGRRRTARRRQERQGQGTGQTHHRQAGQGNRRPVLRPQAGRAPGVRREDRSRASSPRNSRSGSNATC